MSDDVMDAVAPVYNSVGPSFFDYFADRVIDLVEMDPGTVVLDLGSGPGAFLERLKLRAGDRFPRYVAVDVSRPMLREVPVGGVPAARVQSDAVQLGFRDGSVDRVVCSFAVTMFSCARCAAAEVHRVLAPDGVAAFVSVSRARDQLWAWQDELLQRYGVEVPPRRARRFREPRDYETVLAGRFRELEIKEAFAPLHYRDSDEWIAWCASHGGRAFLQQIAPRQRKAFARDVADVLARYSGPDGVDLIMPALIVLARK